MCELILEEGLSLDVASGGELAAARLAAAPPERIYFHGNNKSVAEMELGLETRIGHFVVDSFQEIEALNVAAAGHGLRQPVLVRLTPGVRPSTHSFVQTGQQDSKFGFGLADGMAEEAVRRIMLTEHLELVGVHAHIGSQIFDLTSYQEEVELLFAAVAAWQSEPRLPAAASSTSAAGSASATRRATIRRRSPSSPPRPWTRPSARSSATAWPCRASSSSRAARSPARRP